MNTEKETGMSPLEGASAKELADAIVRILDEKKARDIKLLKFAEGNDLTEYFVICTGTSNTQIKGLAGELEYKLGERGVHPLHVDGFDSGMWIAMDFAHVIVHIFHKSERDFYKLEKLWNDAEEIPLEPQE